MRSALTLGILATFLFGSCGRPPPPKMPDGTIAGPLPPLPAWVEPYVGKPLTEAFPGASETCIGFIDALQARYSGSEGGIQISGWGWSSTGSQAYARLVAVDQNGLIQGGGGSGINRGDVSAAMPQVTDVNVGYSILSRQTSGRTRVYGVAGTSACQLGSELPL